MCVRGIQCVCTYVLTSTVVELLSLITGAFRSAEGLFPRPPSIRPIYTVTPCADSKNCTFNVSSSPSCTHENDIGVFCREEGTPSVCRTGGIRLVGSRDPPEIARDRRIEVCIDNQWGTICDDSWDERGVNLVCNKLYRETGALGFSAYTYLDYSYCIYT